MLASHSVFGDVVNRVLNDLSGLVEVREIVNGMNGSCIRSGRLSLNPCI